MHRRFLAGCLVGHRSCGGPAQAASRPPGNGGGPFPLGRNVGFLAKRGDDPASGCPGLFAGSAGRYGPGGGLLADEGRGRAFISPAHGHQSHPRFFFYPAGLAVAPARPCAGIHFLSYGAAHYLDGRAGSPGRGGRKFEGNDRRVPLFPLAESEIPVRPQREARLYGCGADGPGLCLEKRHRGGSDRPDAGFRGQAFERREKLSGIPRSFRLDADGDPAVHAAGSGIENGGPRGKGAKK